MSNSSHRKIRVLLLCHDLYTAGAQKIALHSFEAMRDQVEVMTVSLADGPYFDRFASLGPVILTSELSQVRPSKGNLGRAARYLLRRKWARRIAEFAPDLIYVNTVASLPLGKILRLPKVPVILHVHEMGRLLKMYADRHLDLMITWPTRYITVSQAARDSLIDAYGIPEEKVSLIHAFMTEHEFVTDVEEPERSGAPLTIGGSGYVNWRKGLDLWLLTAARVKELMRGEKVRFVWVGYTETEDYFIAREQARLLGLDDDVEFVRSTREPRPHFAQFDVFAMCSWEDPFPLVVLECMAMQKAVLCFANGGGSHEQIGEAGIPICGFDTHEMARQIVELWRHPDRRRQLGQAAKERVLSNFTDRTQVPKILQEIRCLVGKEAPRPVLGDFRFKAAPTRPAGGTARPPVSIVIPTYNGARFLRETIASVVAQSYPEWRMIIVDDGSADGSTAIAEEFARENANVKLVRQANSGVAAARNRGLRECDADTKFVLFLDQDDLLEPNSLDLLVTAATTQPGVVGAHGLLKFINDVGAEIFIPEADNVQRRRVGVKYGDAVPAVESDPTTFATLSIANHIYTPGCVLIRKDALDAVGGLDPVTAPADDWDLWLRLCLRGDLAFVNDVVTQWRFHGDNASNNRRLLMRKTDLVHRKKIEMAAGTEYELVAIDGYRHFVRKSVTQSTGSAIEVARIWKRSIMSTLTIVPIVRYLCRQSLRLFVLSVQRTKAASTKLSSTKLSSTKTATTERPESSLV